MNESPFSFLCARLLPAPIYCGDIVKRRLVPGVRLVCVGDSRYLEIKLAGVWRRV